MSSILWISVIWIAPLMSFLLTNETKFKKNIVVGATLPYEARSDEEVLAVLKKFKQQQWTVCGLLMALAGAGWAFAGENMTIWLIWVDLCIILPNIPYVRTNIALKKLKRERGWGGSSAVQSVRVDTAVIGGDKWMPAWIFLPAVILCFVPGIFEPSMWPICITMAVSNVLFWFGYRYCYRNKSEMVDGNVEITRVLSHIRRRNWGRMWLLCAYSMAALVIGIWLTMGSYLWSMVLYVAFTIVIVAATMWVELSTRRIQEKLTADSGQDWYVDEDDKWIGGLIYYNPNDSRLVINSRVGTNSSVNVAHPVGKILTALLLVLLLSFPFIGSFIGGGDVALTVDHDAVYGMNGRTEYVIALDDVKSAELLAELPKGLTRNFGTGMPNLLKGDFGSRDYGRMKVCLDPTVPPFLFIETTEGGKYLLGSRTEGAAQDVYEVLK